MVMGNLLDNAMKYSPAGSPVQFGVETTDDPLRGLRLWVENEEGPAGVPDPVQVFEKYYRNPLARRHSGSGLGLYLTQVFVKALGGSVQCIASNGLVRFELWLPS
jgi:signal transduction histidine kinase